MKRFSFIFLLIVLVFSACDKVKNPYVSDLDFPIISITFSDLTSTYNSTLSLWEWGFQATFTERNGCSATITEIMGRVYFNRSAPLGETIYNTRLILASRGNFSYKVIILSGENVDRIKLFFEGVDENGNYIEGAENFHLNDYPK